MVRSPPRGSFFVRPHLSVKSYFGCKKLKNAPIFMSIIQKLYFDAIYRLKKSRLKIWKIGGVSIVIQYILLFSIVQNGLGHRSLKNAPIRLKFGQKLYFNGLYPLKKKSKKYPKLGLFLLFSIFSIVFNYYIVNNKGNRLSILLKFHPPLVLTIS